MSTAHISLPSIPSSIISNLPPTDSALLAKAEALIDELTSQLKAKHPNMGKINSESKELEKDIEQLLKDATSSSGQSAAGAGSASGQNWLQAIAAALGKKLGDLAKQMETDAGNVNSSDPQTSSAATAALQADAQSFSMMAQALQTVISTAGGALKTLAQA